MTYPNGRTVTYTANAIGQVTTVEATVRGDQVTLALDREETCAGHDFARCGDVAFCFWRPLF